MILQLNVEAETGDALLAGLISGAAAALVVTFILLLEMARSPWWRDRATRTGALPPSLLGVVMVNGMLLAWTAVGLVLGALYLRAESSSPEGVLGSGNRLFSLSIVGAVALSVAVAAFVLGRLTRIMWSVALVAAIAFGWLLPALAQ